VAIDHQEIHNFGNVECKTTGLPAQNLYLAFCYMAMTNEALEPLHRYTF